METMRRRKLLASTATGIASITGVNSVTGRTTCIQCGSGSDDDEKDWSDCAYAKDWSACTLDNFPEYDGWSKEGAKKRENICEFGSEVVFPVLTAASLADGVPLDETIVAAGWASFSGGCYVVEKIDGYNEENVEAVALYTQGSSVEDYASPGMGTSRSILVLKQIV